MMLHIVLVSTLPPGQGSLSEYGQLLVELLLQQGYRLTVLADKLPAGTPETDRAHVRVMRCWQSDDAKVPWQVLRHLRRLNPDAVVFNLQLGSFGHRLLPALPGLLTPALVQAAGWPVLAVWHNLPVTLADFGRVSRWPAWLLHLSAKPLTRLMLRTRRCVVMLERHRRRLEDLGYRHIEVIGLGAALPLAETVQPGKHFLTFGKFGTYKRLNRLLSVVEALSPRYPELELRIGGCDHPETPGYFQALRQRWSHLACVRWLGWIPDEQLAETIRSARAIVLDYEATAGSSGPAHLAASQGRPIIAPALGDFLALAEDEGLQCLLYPPRQQQALSDVLEQALSDRLNLDGLGRRNLEWAGRQSAAVLGQAYGRLLQDLLKPKVSADVWME